LLPTASRFAEQVAVVTGGASGIHWNAGTALRLGGFAAGTGTASGDTLSFNSEGYMMGMKVFVDASSLVE